MVDRVGLEPLRAQHAGAIGTESLVAIAIWRHNHQALAQLADRAGVGVVKVLMEPILGLAHIVPGYTAMIDQVYSTTVRLGRKTAIAHPCTSCCNSGSSRVTASSTSSA